MIWNWNKSEKGSDLRPKSWNKHCVKQKPSSVTTKELFLTCGSHKHHPLCPSVNINTEGIPPLPANMSTRGQGLSLQRSFSPPPSSLCRPRVRSAVRQLSIPSACQPSSSCPIIWHDTTQSPPSQIIRNTQQQSHFLHTHTLSRSHFSTITAWLSSNARQFEAGAERSCGLNHFQTHGCYLQIGFPPPRSPKA